VAAVRTSAAKEAAEKVVYFVILNEVRNFTLVYVQEKRASSARSAPRNDKNLSFSAGCNATESLFGRIAG
jgi:hypothetical protein